MNARTLLLLGSLVANVGLIGFIAFREPTPSARAGSKLIFASSGARDTSDPTRAAATKVAVNGPQAEALAHLFKSTDYTSLRDQFRALGLSEETTNSLVRALIWAPYYERSQVFYARREADAKPYWQGNNFNTYTFTKEERAELRRMSHDATGKILDVLGPDGLDRTGYYAARDSYLPPDKAAQLREIDRDYRELRSELNQEIEGFRLPSDAEKLKFLEKERRKDLEAVLTPQELADYDLRMSPAATQVRARFANISATEEEYKAVFALQKSVDENYRSLDSSEMSGLRSGAKLTPEQIDQLQTRRDAREVLGEQIKSILGEERYAEYQRSTETDYRNLQAASKRFDLAPQTINDVYALRSQTAAASQRIAQDQSLPPAEKKAALATLADQTRKQVRTALGPEIGDAYLSTSMRWLDRVQNGYVVTFNPNGGANFRAVAPAPRPPAPAKPATQVTPAAPK